MTPAVDPAVSRGEDRCELDEALAETAPHPAEGWLTTQAGWHQLRLCRAHAISLLAMLHEHWASQRWSFCTHHALASRHLRCHPVPRRLAG